MNNRALLVIDVQNEYVTGALPITYPDLQASLLNIGRVIDEARNREIPVVVVKQIAPATSPIFALGSEGIELHAVVAERSQDFSVEKTLPSAFAGTGLDEWLKARSIDTVIIVGFMTQNCDESTARDATHLGYSVEFLSDATGTLDLTNQVGTFTAQQIHETTLVVLQSRFAAVASTQQWIEALENGSHLERSSIYKSAVR